MQLPVGLKRPGMADMKSKEKWSKRDEEIVAFYIPQETAVEKRTQETAVVPLIKFFSFLCLLLGFALFALHMEFHPSFTTAWFSNALDEPLDIGSLDWGPETTKQTDVKREGSAGEVLDALPLLAVWGLWGPWSACSKKKYCQEGQQHRRRICVTLEDSAHCVGVSMEARDCPAASCVHAYSTPPVLADQSPAPATSFLGQECNATVKYSASGKYSDLVPSAVYHLFPSAKKMLKSGFFAVQVLPKILEKESSITKVCFEPFGLWSVSAARKVFHLNRATRASLKELKSSRLVGLAISLQSDGTLYGVLLATGSPGGLYSYVYYRRFRGRSFHEEISF